VGIDTEFMGQGAPVAFCASAVAAVAVVSSVLPPQQCSPTKRSSVIRRPSKDNDD
jgi:hypothetical protein